MSGRVGGSGWMWFRSGRGWGARGVGVGRGGLVGSNVWGSGDAGYGGM